MCGVTLVQGHKQESNGYEKLILMSVSGQDQATGKKGKHCKSKMN